MSENGGKPGLTRDGLQNARPDREAMTGVHGPRHRGGRRRGRGEQPMVPDATFTSYYGKPILNPPVWQAPDIPGYLFLGGLAGASSVMALGAELTGRPEMARASKVGAFGAISLGAVALVNDLGRPARFTNMLRVFKPTSPMSVGSWFLAGYGPAAGVSAATAVTGLFPRLGRVATVTAAAIGPLVASYTAALICDTAVPAWHEGYREMPYLFVASGTSAAAGLAVFASPVKSNAPARTAALVGSSAELALSRLIGKRLGQVGEPYHSGSSGRLMKAAEAITAGSVALAAVGGRRSRWAATLGGLGLVAGSALTRFGIFEAGMVSANDPKYTVDPQRRRLQEHGSAKVS